MTGTLSEENLTTCVVDEASDPAQFELQVPHWSPDFEFQDWQQAAESAESATSWQATELTLDALLCREGG